MAQTYSSKGTCIGQLPALHTWLRDNGYWNPNEVFLDYGAGKTDKSTGFWVNSSVTCYRYDKYNLNQETNDAMLICLGQEGGADRIVLANVLNVVKEMSARIEILEHCKELLKPGGQIWIQCYKAKRSVHYREDGRSNTGQPVQRKGKPSQWQNCQNMGFYQDEAGMIFSLNDFNFFKQNGYLCITHIKGV